MRLGFASKIYWCFSFCFVYCVALALGARKVQPRQMNGWCSKHQSFRILRSESACWPLATSPLATGTAWWQIPHCRATLTTVYFQGSGRIKTRLAPQCLEVTIVTLITQDNLRIKQTHFSFLQSFFIFYLKLV